ncbi:DUF6884 domain-containing protein [Ralstonia nicotianae]|uniref:DUF6884 domain-containing protein n=1 Tax=Ralstonia pseudosolanacearum TaxID=1310165 RepID=UPI002E2463A2|nr:DUF6884 domain-containing protein [Ralstonia pseudosolanacearum]
MRSRSWFRLYRRRTRNGGLVSQRSRQAILRSPFHAGLLDCKKCEYAAQAKDFYISEWFVRARAYVERSGCPWFILSAKFGLIRSELVIEPYEFTLNNMVIAERRAWVTRVQLPMERSLSAGRRCAVLAGHRYREVLMDFLVQRYTTDVPMRGLAIGKQLRWLATH